MGRWGGHTRICMPCLAALPKLQGTAERVEYFVHVRVLRRARVVVDQPSAREFGLCLPSHHSKGCQGLNLDTRYEVHTDMSPVHTAYEYNADFLADHAFVCLLGAADGFIFQLRSGLRRRGRTSCVVTAP